MYRTGILLLASMLLGLSACSRLDTTSAYESEELVVVQHNAYNQYLLLVYRDPLGQTRHVLRRNGVTEMILTYKMEGIIKLKIRGKRERSIEAVEAGRLTQRINSLLKASEEGNGQVTST
jgi:hypothetical protein